jgi:hypothetical protein
MDPYLEAPANWPGVHLALLVAIQAQLNRVLPPGYIARVDEYVWVRDTEEPDYRAGIRPDVYIPEPTRSGGNGTAIARRTTAPTVLGTLPESKKRKRRSLQITTARDRDVLTALELLSPSNKENGEDRDAYVQKRRNYLGSVNFLEIDLLRVGSRFPTGRPLPPPLDYCVFLCRKNEYPATATWAFTVRDEMPVIPVPIDRGITDVSLDLRAAFDRVYDEGRYDETDYTVPPVPPLRPIDAAWAADLLKKAARKKKK